MDRRDGSAGVLAEGDAQSDRGTDGSSGSLAVANISNRPQVYNQLGNGVLADVVEKRWWWAPPGMVQHARGVYINKWLHDPAAVKAGAKMPKLPLTDEQIDELTAFLSNLKTEVKP